MTTSPRIITFLNKITQVYPSILLWITRVGLARRTLVSGSLAFLILLVPMKGNECGWLFLRIYRNFQKCARARLRHSKNTYFITG